MGGKAGKTGQGAGEGLTRFLEEHVAEQIAECIDGLDRTDPAFRALEDVARRIGDSAGGVLGWSSDQRGYWLDVATLGQVEHESDPLARGSAQPGS